MGLMEWFMGTQTTPDLMTCEKRIERGLAAYRDAGEALKTIRDAKLYRTVCDTFENYCRQRWQMDDNHARRLIQAAEVAQNLMPSGMVPRNEKTARPLALLKEPEQLEAWAEAQTAAAPGEPTSRHVSEAVAKRRKPQGKTTRTKPIRLKVPGAIVIIEPGRGYVDAESALLSALAKVGVIIDKQAA